MYSYFGDTTLGLSRQKLSIHGGRQTMERRRSRPLAWLRIDCEDAKRKSPGYAAERTIILPIPGRSVWPRRHAQQMPDVSESKCAPEFEVVFPRVLNVLILEWDFHFRQVDARLALVRRIVTHPKQAILPDQAGITRVAPGWQLEKLRQFACVCVQPRQRSSNRTIV